MASRRMGLVFDLDGTLVDSVYQHVLAWREALESLNIEVAVWRLHRRIGMSGGLLAHALLRETGRTVTVEEAERLQRLHGEAFLRHLILGAAEPTPLTTDDATLATPDLNADQRRNQPQPQCLRRADHNHRQQVAPTAVGA